MSAHSQRGTLAIFSGFRRLLEAILALVSAVESLAKVQGSAAPAIERLDALELSRFHFEAEVSGILLEAKGKLRASNNAEARERQMKKAYEANLDSFDPPGGPESGVSPIPPDHVEASEAERVSALRLDVAPDNKALAVRAKWAR